ncbi:MAG TPA: helix-turn-helix transcriptional regulator [Candidatus Aquicultor sp.]|jgi:RNA polymerase sigma factor (sigma-70 family)
MHEVRNKLVAEQTIILVLLMYRVVTLVYAAILGLTGLGYLSLPLFAAVMVYTVLIIAFRTQVVRLLLKYPLLMLVDVALMMVLELSSGAYKNPYSLYTFSPLLIGGYLFRYSGAFIIGSIQNILITIADWMLGYSPLQFEIRGQSIMIYIFTYYVTAYGMAYLSELTSDLEAVNKTKANVQADWIETRKLLEASLQKFNLSQRESQVLMLLFDGLTYEQIASELDVTNNTIKTYVKRVYEKLQVSTKQEALSTAMRLNGEVG